MYKNNQNNKIHDHEIHEEIHELFSIAKENSLSHEEKTEGALFLKNFIEKHGSVKSKFLFTSPFVKSRQLVVVVLTLILIFGGSVTAYAAGNSLPGDLLYPIKINVNEKLEIALARGTEAKARIAVKHTVVRIDEIEKLTIKGKIDDSKDEFFNTILDAQSKRVRDNILKLKEEGRIDAAIIISSDLENSLIDRKKNLENITKDKKLPLLKTLEKIEKDILDFTKERSLLESSLATSSKILIDKKDEDAVNTQTEAVVPVPVPSVGTSSVNLLR